MFPQVVQEVVPLREYLPFAAWGLAFLKNKNPLALLIIVLVNSELVGARVAFCLIFQVHSGKIKVTALNDLQKNHVLVFLLVKDPHTK